MRKLNKCAVWILGLYLSVTNVKAAITVTNGSPITWGVSSTVAAYCSVTLPTLKPLSQSRTLIIDNNLPIGSVLHSWGYSDFVPDMHFVCLRGEESTVNSMTTDSSSATISVFLNGVQSLAGTMMIPTSNPGIGLKLYYTYTEKGSGNTGTSTRPESTELLSADGTVIGAEFPIVSAVPIFIAKFHPVTNSTSPPYKRFFDGTANYFKVSLRGELIKIGQVTESVGLQVSNPGSMFGIAFSNGLQGAGGGIISGTEILGSGGINTVNSTCRLRGSTDYSVELGSWESMSPGNLPAYSESKPVDINLECSGKLNNVEFSFQDTGSSSLSNRNISVYDRIGGQPIDGLEIEMSYAGSRIDVHKISESPASYKINTGAHGSVKTNPADTSFDSQSQAQFGARFIQRAAIMRAGNAYTGPVTGQVNMFVTYN